MKIVKIAGVAVVAVLLIVFLAVSGKTEKQIIIAASDTSKAVSSDTSAAGSAVTEDTASMPNAATLTVIIDPGHGFGDPGSSPEPLGCAEKEITLKAARYLKEALEEKGVKAILTHDGKSYPRERDIMSLADSLGIIYEPEKIIEDNNVFSAYERMIYEQTLEKQYDNCFFISLHTNSVENAPNKMGSVIDWCAENPDTARIWDFANELADVLHTELGVHLTISEDSFDMAFKVTKNVRMPAVLLEMGYGSNREDAQKLRSDDYLCDYAEILAQAVVLIFA